MIVDRLQDRLAATQQAQMLLEHVDIIRAWVERGQASSSALRAVVAMVVVGADHRAVRLAQNLSNAS
jgi:RNase adaptor protein for sRNA GlmZ degradation